MNDQQKHSFLEKPAAVPPSGPAAAAGAMLREAREAAGIHLAALAVSLKVPPARLEALEAGRIDLLPDMVFARALAASICRTLKLDPEPVLKQLPRTASTAAAAGHPPFKPQAAQPVGAARWGGLSTKPFLIAALVLVLAALALVFVPELNWENFAAHRSATGGNAPAASGAQLGARPAEVLERPAATAAAPAPAASVTAPAPAVSASAPVAGAPESAAAPAAAPAESAAASTPAEPSAGDTVVFRTQSDAWISVIDGKGTSLIRKTVPAGQTVGVSGALPLRVTVGRADVTKVSVRGQPLDLAPLSKGSVARFEVK